MKTIIANWKMNMTYQDISTWMSDFAGYLVENKNILNSSQKLQIILAPTALYVKDVAEMVKHLQTEVFVAAQEVSEKRKGAYTGAISAKQVKDFCKFSIVGHSETRPIREDTLSKAELCLEEEITPIVCFAKFEDARDYERQGAILAWEDPANISKEGIYREKNNDDIKKAFHEMRLAIRDEVTLIYGGSVNRTNVRDLVKIPEIDGVLVGNASLEAKHFIDIISAFCEA